VREAVCAGNPPFFSNLLEQVGKLRKRGLWDKFDEILNEIVADADEG
jgi:hypothetical protein